MDEGSTQSFMSFAKTIPYPIVGFADFESVMIPVEEEATPPDKKKQKTGESWSKKLTEHRPITYSLVIVDQNYDILYQVI